MSPWLLKAFRFFVPAALILVYWSIFGKLVGLWTIQVPDFSKDYYLPIVIGPAAIYYITPLRKWVNSPHHKRITDNIRRELINIGGYPDNAEKFTWKALRPLFFSLIDNDESLKNKATMAYMNGLLWSSFANSTAICLCYSIIALGLLAFGMSKAVIAVAAFCIIALISIAGSVVTTNNQIEISNEQLEIIELKYQSDVEQRLIKLDR